LRRRAQSESGMTLVELSVTVALLGIVMMALVSTVWTIQNAFNRQADRSASVDQVRLAVEELDKEIRSGNLLYDPASEPNIPSKGIQPYMSLRVYTQANASTRNPGNRCVEWRIISGQLQRRDWSENYPADGSVVNGWRTIATNVVNVTASPQVRAFQLATSNPSPNPTPGTPNQYGSRTLDIAILVQANSWSGSPVEVDESVTGRDTEYGYPTNVCSTVPPY
jgi:prepilin-type N-terminal cleavage/methylation domain-containing protein